LKKVLIIQFLFIAELLGQPMLEWARSYNGPASGRDAAGSIAIDDSGYIYVRGGLTGQGTNNFSYCTIKYQPNGDSIWVRIYQEPGNTFNVGSGLNIDNLGNVYVTGFPATIKYDSFGNVVWIVTSSVFTGIKIDFDLSGNIYVGGTTINKFTLKKYTNTGVLLWSRIYDDGGGGTAKDMAVDKLGNIILAGEMAYNNGNSYDFLTVKYNSLGDTLWSRRYNGAGNPPYDWANAIDIDDSGYVYVTGLSNTSNSTDYLTFKYSPMGQEIWMKRYTGGIAYDLSVDKSGNIFVAGVTNLNNYTLLKYNYLGNLLWSATTPAYTFAVGSSITLDTSGNVYLGGARQSNLIILKYNTNGFEQWTAMLPQGSVNDLTLDRFGNIYACGEIYSSTNFGDLLTVKYSQPIGIQPISNEIPVVYKLHQNFPNPFNPETKIRFQVPKLSNVKVVIYDILGKAIKLLINESLSPSTYEINWNAENYPSGVYFCKLSTNEFQEMIKLSLVK
jgi:hypothetical protein